MERVSQANPAAPARLPSPSSSSSPRHSAPDEGFFEGSSCCSLNDDSCYGLFGWIKTAWDSFLEFFSGLLCCFCSRAPASPEAPQQDLIRLDPNLAGVMAVTLFLEKYPQAEGIIKPTSERGRVYLDEFDELPVEVTDSAINALVEIWSADEAECGFAVMKEQNRDSRQTQNFNLLLRARLKNNLNHKCIHEALGAWVKSKNVN